MNLTLIFYILTILSSAWGLWITVRIFHEKRSKKPMVCPLGADCETVVHSEFSSFLGIGLELYGAAYYALMVVCYSVLLILLPNALPDMVRFLLTGISAGGFLFSLYLTFVQAFYIKSWCTWCLFSTGASTLIFIFTTLGLIFSDFNLIPILEFFYYPILITHVVGFILGVGGATISDILFIKFLKDFKISIFEDKVLKIMSQIVWVGLFLIVISGVGLYLPQAEVLLQTPKFLVKMLIVFVIIINGALLNLIISPRLIKISFGQCLDINHTHRLRKVAFMLGAISFSSWYSALILGIAKVIPMTFGELITIYLLIVLCAVLSSQVAEGLYSGYTRNCSTK